MTNNALEKANNDNNLLPVAMRFIGVARILSALFYHPAKTPKN